MGCDFQTPSKLCTVYTGSPPPPTARRQGLCDTSIAFGSIKQGFSNLSFFWHAHRHALPLRNDNGLCLSNTFETLHSLNRISAPPTARRQGLCDTSISFDSIKQGFSNLSFFWHAHRRALPLRQEYGLCLSNTFEIMRSLDRTFVLPTARRQVIRDTSIGFGSIKQGFSDLGFSGTPTVTPYPFATTMGCAFRTPSKLCAVLTGPSSFPLQGGK